MTNLGYTYAQAIANQNMMNAKGSTYASALFLFGPYFIAIIAVIVYNYLRDGE